MNEINNLNLYERDFIEWIEKTIILLREKKYELLDIENLIEEISDREKKEATSRLTTIIEDLLKII